MKLTVNAAGFNNSVQMGTKDGQSVRTVKNAAFGGATKLGEDPVAKRREEARTAGVEGRGKCVEK